MKNEHLMDYILRGFFLSKKGLLKFAKCKKRLGNTDTLYCTVLLSHIIIVLPTVQ